MGAWGHGGSPHLPISPSGSSMRKTTPDLSSRSERARTSPSSVSELLDIAGAMAPKTVAIAGGEREVDLRLVEAARDHGLIRRVLLVGDTERIRKAGRANRLAIEDADLIPACSEEEAAARTAELVGRNEVDLVLKGSISTPVLSRALFPFRTRRTVSLVTLFDASPIGGGRLMALTDAGVTTRCDADRMADLIENAAEVVRTVLGRPWPRAAVLSANEKQIESLPSTSLAAELTARSWEDVHVYGPLSLDLAVDPEAVAAKRLGDLAAETGVMGQADILVCPGIDAANVFYKLLMELCKYGVASTASMAVGLTVPYILLSRADPVDAKLDSIALGCIYAERMMREARSSASRGDAANTLSAEAPDKERAMSDDRTQRWIFRAHVMDRAGALTSITSAFSSRGVSIDTVIGHGAEHTPTHDGTVVVTFRCTEEEKDALVRVIERQTKVSRVEEHPYESETLREAALVRTSRELLPGDVVGERAFITCEPIGHDHTGWRYFLAAAPNELDPVIDRLIEKKILLDSVYSVSAL